jgi:hypothetical protein
MELTTNLICQKKAQHAQEQSRKREEILQDSAKEGLSTPSWNVYGTFNNMQLESVLNMKDIVWSSLEKALDEFKPPYCPELADELFKFCQTFFPETLCEPHRLLENIEWKHPCEEDINKRLKGALEYARNSSLQDLRTKIDVYTTNLKSQL